jgi:hypothetical protein
MSNKKEKDQRFFNGLFLVLEHIQLSQETNTGIYWDLVETMIFPDVDRLDSILDSSNRIAEDEKAGIVYD